MIVQCRQCRTKFRFDDNLMQGDGVWMRCSRCLHVFFQDNPQAALSGGTLKAENEISPVPEAAAETSAVASTKEMSISGSDEDVSIFLDNVMMAKKGMSEETIPEEEIKEREEIVKDEDISASPMAQADDEEIKKKNKKSSVGGFRRALRVALWIVLVVVVIPALLYVYVFPQTGERLAKMALSYLESGSYQAIRPETVIGQIKLQDIRQRILNNHVVGTLRVIEGVALNQADFTVSRIRIKAEIVGDNALVLEERVSFAGNVLSDDDLMVLPEEEILKRLNQPEGINNSNDKIIRGGQIPFMIVFAREPVGVVKTTVRTTAAERLL